MRSSKITVLVALACASCSRSSVKASALATASATAAPSASAAPSAAASAAPSAAAPPPLPDLHSKMPLPSTPYDPDDPSSSPMVNLGAGRGPGGVGMYSEGTVFVTEQTGGRASPLVLTEWDLASGKEVQHTTLPLQPGVTMANLPVGLVIVGFGSGTPTGHDGTFLLVGPTLKIRAKTPIKSFGGIVQAIASDNALTAVVFTEYTPDGANEVTRTLAATWDSNGKPVAQRALDPIGQHIDRGAPLVVDSAVVTEGTLYVLHHANGATHLLHLAPDLQQLGDRVLARGHFVAVRLRVWRDQLIADVGKESFTVSLDLESVEPMPAGPQRPPVLARPSHDRVFMQDVQAELASDPDGKKMNNWVAWGRVAQ